MDLVNILICQVAWNQGIGNVGQFVVVYTSVAQRDALIGRMFRAYDNVEYVVHEWGTLEDVLANVPGADRLVRGWARNMRPNYAMLGLGLSAV